MDAKTILLLTLAGLTAVLSPLNIYGEKLQDARRWYERGREAMRQCHPQRGAGDARENCAPRIVDELHRPQDATRVSLPPRLVGQALGELPGGGPDGRQARFVYRAARGRRVGEHVL